MSDLSGLHLYIEFSCDGEVVSSDSYPLEDAKTITLTGAISEQVSRISVYTEKEIRKRTEKLKERQQICENTNGTLTLLQKVLGEELAEECLEEILERQRPDDSIELTNILRKEIIRKYIQEAELSNSDIQLIFSNLKDDCYRYITDRVKNHMKHTAELNNEIRDKLLPDILCDDMTPEFVMDRTKFKDSYKRTASKSEK